MKINIITLGCSKNLVDSEYLLRQFDASGHKVFHDATGLKSDVVILNTCGFILDAKEESIATILQYVDLKKQGSVKKVLVMGCLSERYRADLEQEIPEVDGFFGVWDHAAIVKAVGADYYPQLANDRITTTPGHYAFLKISEGCNRRCAFCAIPGIRGDQRSRSIKDLAEEAGHLISRGARELILIAQDLTNYGVDLTGRRDLPQLLKKLASLEGAEWIRLHYAYPTGFPEEVIDLMASTPNICNYLDIPIQHINDRILRSMNRGHDRRKLEKLLCALRQRVPGVAIRTTVLVGYPGETGEEFMELYDFVKAFRFERLGVFPYSHEEDTPAAALQDDIPEKVKQERASRIMELQQEISLEINTAKVGKTFRVLIDAEEAEYYTGRTEFDSPEVDNEVLVSKHVPLEPGTFVNVRINDAGEFDLFGDVVV
ncbi:MAG: 30S ribosomal protein S12 methylthiotransferase RimO [Bacteroidales bacterium]|nr:30S ribosomal protein S12 methylthiotransferase RimO [Bacteroidales bacterium]MDT8430872.1 30S ribosomal protein S12 methylthiotransferase RimO [Bacteroidales bacterium]